MTPRRIKDDASLPPTPLLFSRPHPEQVVVRETQAACGNGEVELEEECDDGNSVDTDLCTGACRLARCGDGITVAINGLEDEACDDGNLEDTDACLSNLRPSGLRRWHHAQ